MIRPGRCKTTACLTFGTSQKFNTASHTHTRTHTLSFSQTLSLTHTHTHTLSLSLFSIFFSSPSFLPSPNNCLYQPIKCKPVFPKRRYRCGTSNKTNFHSSKYCSPIHGFCGTLAGTNSLGLRLYCPEMIIMINVFLLRKILSEGTILSAFKHTGTRTRRHILYTVHNLQPTQKRTYFVHCTQSTTNSKTDIFCTLYTIYNQLKNRHILYTVHRLQPT